MDDEVQREIERIEKIGAVDEPATLVVTDSAGQTARWDNHAEDAVRYSLSAVNQGQQWDVRASRGRRSGRVEALDTLLGSGMSARIEEIVELMTVRDRGIATLHPEPSTIDNTAVTQETEFTA